MFLALANPALSALRSEREDRTLDSLTHFSRLGNFRTEASMKKVLFLFAIVLALTATPLYAQQGCINSPENPTALLALVGSAGAFIASARGRFRRK